MERQCTGSRTKLQRWVDPSFCDLTSDVCEEKKPRPRKPKAGTGTRPGTGTGPGTKLRPGAGTKVAVDQDKAWVDRHSPNTQAELAVHKKKIEEVEKWLKEHLSRSMGGVLLLTGPSGCGKTATVQVLCKEMETRVQEWSNPESNHQDWQSDPPLSWSQVKDLPSLPRSQLQQFQDFLLRSQKYNCLRMRGEEPGGAKVILVEDFPNVFYRQPSGLHDTLRRFVRTSRVPLVFIVSDSVSADSSSRRLFPRELQEELHMDHISFNPVAPTAMMKVLSRVSALELDRSVGCVSPDSSLLERLCVGCSGDIRSAINNLQFSCVPGGCVERGLPWRGPQGPTGRGRSKAPRSKRRRPEEQEEEQAIGGKDSTLFLFRALGKILHCKRQAPEGPGPEGGILPEHLSQHHREALQLDPEAVVERSHLSSHLFSLYLHQNYLDFFSETEDVERASDYLSDADLLSADWTSRSLLSDYSSSVATRGLLHSQSHQSSAGFRPLHKPHWLQVNDKYRATSLSVQSLFRSFCLGSTALQTELLPFLSKLPLPMRSQAQVTLIQDVGQLRLRREAHRLKLETVADKEPGEIPEEEEEKEEEEQKEQKEQEEKEGCSDEGLSHSQDKPTSTQSLMEPEEELIEEYNSD